jgi:hypothetical protein
MNEIYAVIRAQFSRPEAPRPAPRHLLSPIRDLLSLEERRRLGAHGVDAG